MHLKRNAFTISRLKFFSVLTGVRRILFFPKALKVEVTDNILWTDSKCVLQWVKGGGNELVFVRNRISEITDKQEMTRKIFQ